jgi:hypothetical protein
VTATRDRAAQRALLERFAGVHAASVWWDPAASVVVDVFSGKALPLDLGAVASIEERTDRGTGRPYLAVLREDGVEIALGDAGVAFPPVTAATGPLAGVPAAVCFRDLAQSEATLGHFLAEHRDGPPDRAHVDLFLFCLAVVDGARAAGFDVGREERHLERLLADLEARRRG